MELKLIKEHEIPNGSKLYFSKSAKTKREIENKIASFLYQNGFEEIVTPFFSYTSHLSIDDETKLIKLNDENNNSLTLRYDSTIDVARIVTKRLGRTTSHKKWFYIQPIFSYPTIEEYQIGIEWLNENDFLKIVLLATDILKLLNLNYTFQLCNINIPYILTKELGLDIDIFKNGDLYKLFGKYQWLDDLIKAKDIQTLQKLKKSLPSYIYDEVNDLINIAKQIDYKQIIISPLFYAPLKYYNNFYFRVLEKNFVILKGGSYKNDGLNSIGFSINIDNLIKGSE